MSLSDSSKYISLFAYQCSRFIDFISIFIRQNKLARDNARGRLVALRKVLS